ncbi:hypothetical protein DEO72_LG8g251 [Vigna unguiculata]|uniref:Uncharacterized protein n=1 Tax=Vigna unguiculata TaxID=3917 RepID=A0A4D6ML00_VIGUN|nr:hypothetical protein DEO72_LG8g251 [Vigna unguiculata]
MEEKAIERGDSLTAKACYIGSNLWTEESHMPERGLKYHFSILFTKKIHTHLIPNKTPRSFLCIFDDFYDVGNDSEGGYYARVNYEHRHISITKSEEDVDRSEIEFVLSRKLLS